MVSMGMGDEDGIQMVHIVKQHLLPEIGTDIEQNVAAFIGTQ